MTLHEHAAPKHYSRFIVLGDSFSEGIGDEVYPETGQYRGWADRVADGLARRDDNFTYLNLAVRGKLIRQVVEDQLPIALKHATEGNVLVSFHAGANDLLRPSYNHQVATAQYADAVRAVRATGADLILFTVAEPPAGKGRTAERLAAKIAKFNQAVRSAAEASNAILIEAAHVEILKDRRFWDRDRLHLNGEGHRRVSIAVLQMVAYSTDSSWREELPPIKARSKVIAQIQDVRWFISFFLPWVWRRLRGRSSGDGRNSKQSEPTLWAVKI
ncbi:GDSL-like lipase/acylhydrolase [mine drainage metagenome]|uniref:GDSL-like lipase/acylhydrolase n=1 Tax=mine drainage metagenome TaxID=410659 RepID=A0A1J5QMA0_9ZZZZ